MKEVKDEYKKYKEQFTSLPDYEELDKEFELLYIRQIVEVSDALVFIRRRIYDKMGWVCGLLQGLLLPNPNSSISMEEASFFPKEKKDEIITLLKKLMYYERLSVHLDIQATAEENASFIQDAYAAWKELKTEIYAITNNLKEGWKSKTTQKNKNQQYMG